MKTLHLIIAESALETIPKEIINHPQILKDAKRRGKDPRFMILDRSRHHEAMKNLKDSHKRGRPDIVYLSLQVTQYTPMNSAGLLRTYIHTIDNKVIFIDPTTRIPRNYNNFIGLIEQLYKLSRVPPTGKPLLTLRNMNLKELIDYINPSVVILLDDVKGIEITFRDLVNQIINLEYPCVIVGGFPHGEFSEFTYSIVDKVYKIGKNVYSTFLIISKLITYIENRIGLEE